MVFRDFMGASRTWGKDDRNEKAGWGEPVMERAEERVGSSKRLWKSAASWESSWAQLPGEYSCKWKPKGIQHRSVTHRQREECRCERGMGGKRERRQEKKEMKLEKEQARTNSEVKKCRRDGEKQILLFEGRLYDWLCEFMVCRLILLHVCVTGGGRDKLYIHIYCVCGVM